MNIKESFLRPKLLFPLAWDFSYIRVMCLIYNWWSPCMSVCVGMPACSCHFESCCLFVWGIFSWHVSCAVKAYCALSDYLSSQASSSTYSPTVPLPLLFQRSPSLCLSFYLTPACLLSFSLSLLFSDSVYPARKVTPVPLRLVFSLICFFFSLKGIQTWNNQCRSSWNSCQSGWQLPFIRHVQ